jgi:hypothetical protein
MAMLARLYQQDAQGLADEILIDEVGLGLYLRCRSILMVTEAREVDCPSCGELIACAGERWSRERPVVCAKCGFSATYGQWRDSWRNQELAGGNAVRIYRAYMAAWLKARTAPKKLLLIDQLVHAFHYSVRNQQTTRPVARQLIAGSAERVLAFLDTLSQTHYTTDELNERHAEWQRTLERSASEFPHIGEWLEKARAVARAMNQDEGDGPT